MTDDEITRKLQAWLKGEQGVVDELSPFLVANMRAIAHRMARQGPTLNTTALVNETWLRLAGADVAPNDREHFLSLVARAMRQIIIDHARGRLRLKRGGGAIRVTLDENSGLTEPQIEQLLMIDDLLDRLEKESPRRRRIFELRFFGGFSVEEVAETLHLWPNRSSRITAWRAHGCASISAPRGRTPEDGRETFAMAGTRAHARGGGGT